MIEAGDMRADVMLERAANLRRRAAHTRELTRGIVSDATAVELEAIAAEYERDATTLETLAGRQPRPKRKRPARRPAA